MTAVMSVAIQRPYPDTTGSSELINLLDVSLSLYRRVSVCDGTAAWIVPSRVNHSGVLGVGYTP